VKFRLLIPIAAALLLSSCAQKDRIHTMRVSVADQKMIVYRKGVPIAIYDVSTSKYGLGDQPGSYRTPIGKMEVAKKIGHGAPVGMKFKSRRPTGEIVPVNAPGRDPIVTRILWLRGLEEQNRRTHGRTIYIHGTPEERNIGRPVSYGCIRMRSRDVIELFSTVGEGAKIEVTPAPLGVRIAHAVTEDPEQRQSIQ
jgi:lipoprotein-anchoring transpeptidase ErfK/SrfK